MKVKTNILVIDDERSIRNVLKDILENEGYKVDTAEDGEQGLELFSNNPYDVILLDIKLPRIDGHEVFEKIHSLNPDVPVIIISGHGNIETAVNFIKQGAYDYLEKPFDRLDRLMISIRNATEKKQLISETKRLKKKVNKKYEIIGEAPAIKQVKELIEKVAPTEARVLITGSNGTGKELVAHWIHEKSNRSAGPFVEVNCAAIPSELIESELFGHEKGAFTSAIKQHKGKFEQANGGTLFLDEIGDMSLSAQAKVLRALQENKIARVGGDKLIPVDVRVIAATNQDLEKLIEEKKFRLDLYHRLSVIKIKVPDLKDRLDDIPLLVNHFVELIAEEYNMPKKEFNEAAIEQLKKYEWKGNVRELRNVVERLMILGGKTITADDVKSYL
jgi:two-component system nitrogen regulation response regulator NtrX